jgi:hypothetical protein
MKRVAAIRKKCKTFTDWDNNVTEDINNDRGDIYSLSFKNLDTEEVD